ncbi:hypothetical protein PV325_008033 [Microctonus aethiopoides]|nr:hypothetical protein PV325_008033 [Microctonus aethiopoides]
MITGRPTRRIALPLLFQILNVMENRKETKPDNLASVCASTLLECVMVGVADLLFIHAVSHLRVGLHAENPVHKPYLLSSNGPGV